MIQESEIAREAWRSSIPVVFVVAPNEVSSLTAPKPFYVRHVPTHAPPLTLSHTALRLRGDAYQSCTICVTQWLLLLLLLGLPDLLSNRR